MAAMGVREALDGGPAKAKSGHEQIANIGSYPRLPPPSKFRNRLPDLVLD